MAATFWALLTLETPVAEEVREWGYRDDVTAEEGTAPMLAPDSLLHWRVETGLPVRRTPSI